MKSIIATAILAAAGMAQAGTTTAFLENFEGAAQWSGPAEFSDNAGDFWGNSGNISWGTFVNYMGADGNYFAGMDLDGDGASVPITQTFNTFSILDLTDLTFSVDLAEDQDGTNEDWDDIDFVTFEYQVDGGAWMNIFDVLGVDNGTAFNQEPAINGMAGSEISDTFATFSFDLTGVTGSTMAVRTIWLLEAGDEDLAIDNVTVTGTLVPAPGAAVLFGFAGLTASRRRRG